MFNYLLILDGKIIKRYKSLKRSLNGFERIELEKQSEQYLELYSLNDGLIKETF